MKVNARKAVEYAYAKYCRALFGVISRIIAERDIAEEVFHDAFVKFFKKMDTYDESNRRLYTWMSNYCRNAAIDKTRSKEFSEQRKTNTVDEYVYGLESHLASADLVDGIGVKELIGALIDDQKFIINRIYFEDYTQTGISGEYDIPLGTVKSRIRAAINVLKKEVDKLTLRSLQAAADAAALAITIKPKGGRWFKDAA